MTASRRALIVLAAFVAVMLGLPWSGAVPAAFAQIQVTSANPPSGEQGTLNLNVLIKGKGFKNGAKAKFYKTGTTDPAGVNVKSTQYVSSTQLVANIDIADTAALALFDIEVRNADGRTGKGTELFSVVAKKIDPCTLPNPEPSPSPYVSYVPGFPGYLDGTFGNGTGRVIGPRHVQMGNVSRGPSLAIQNIDGQARIIGVGVSSDVCANSAQGVWAVARYLPDGSLDPGFGSGGVATKSFSGSGYNRPSSVAIQPDNKIVVAGQSPSRSGGLPTIVRFNADGALDTTFGSGGVVVLTTPGKSPQGTLYTVAIQSDRKIVAAGAAAYTPGYMVRLNPNGSVDTSFSAYAGPTAKFTALRVQRLATEERIVLTGGQSTANGYRAAVWRFTSSGAPDTSFGGTGMVVTSFQGENCLYFHCEELFNDVAIDASNHITAAGYARKMPDYPASLRVESQLAVARYDTLGQLDSTFGIGGSGTVLAASGQAAAIVTASAVQADGRIVVGGYSCNYDTAGFETDRTVGVWRFNGNGTVDETFGAGGWVSDPVTSGAGLVYFMGMALQPDGKIVCGGYVVMESDPRIYYAVLGRFWQ